MRKSQRGFTLVELMIVVAIIGIVAAVALPAYQSYTIRAKVSEAILAGSQCLAAVGEAYQTNPGSGPGANNRGRETASQSSKYVASVETDDNGQIMVTSVASTELGGATGGQITLTPQSSTGTPLTLLAIPTQVGTFMCAPVLAAMNQFLPGSCK